MHDLKIILFRLVSVFASVIRTVYFWTHSLPRRFLGRAFYFQYSSFRLSNWRVLLCTERALHEVCCPFNKHFVQIDLSTCDVALISQITFRYLSEVTKFLLPLFLRYLFRLLVRYKLKQPWAQPSCCSVGGGSVERLKKDLKVWKTKQALVACFITKCKFLVNELISFFFWAV